MTISRDASLELDAAGAELPFFAIGLVLFLASHLAYLVALVAAPGSPGGWAASLARAVGAAPRLAFVAYAFALLAYLLPSIEEGFLRGAVVAYAAVLASLGCVACGSAADATGAGVGGRGGGSGGCGGGAAAARLAAWGSVLFVASDSLLAIDRFATPLPCARWAVMTTYFAAQGLLAESFAAPRA